MSSDNAGGNSGQPKHWLLPWVTFLSVLVLLSVHGAQGRSTMATVGFLCAGNWPLQKAEVSQPSVCQMTFSQRRWEIKAQTAWILFHIQSNFWALSNRFNCPIKHNGELLASEELLRPLGLFFWKPHLIKKLWFAQQPLKMVQLFLVGYHRKSSVPVLGRGVEDRGKLREEKSD